VPHNKDGEQKLYRLFGLFSVSLLIGSSLNAESFAEFKQTQAESYSKYKDARDNAFNSYLKEEWKGYKAYMTPPMYEEPKPKSITPKLEQKAPDVGPIVRIEIPKKPFIQKATIPKKELKKEKQKGIVFGFFGSKLIFTRDKKIQNVNFYPQNQMGISNFFTLLASSNYTTTLDEIKRYKREFNLNDWGVYLLVTKLSQKVYHKQNEAKIYKWFLLNKLSYNVKIALSESKNIYLLHYSKDIIYATPRYNFNGKYYYIITKYNKKNIENIYTYGKNYPDADKALNFKLNRLPNFQKDMGVKKVSFRDYGKDYSASYSYNKNIIDFMNTYPQVDYKVYFNAPVEFVTYSELAKDIKRYTDGKKISEAMNFVLRFVQKAFKYERDEDQFGHEKVMFAEETLYYNASDCEDRAILFSYLIKKLFGISVVGVKYSDHMSTALYIPLKGDSVMVGRYKYIMADPTYINANIGQEMPKYRNIQPEYFIRLSSHQ
jgi:hypothetical protein